jgi:hypothetical protein
MSRVESYVTTDGQSASVSWIKAPSCGLWPDFHYCQAVAGLLMWGALSDERTGLSFTIAVGLRQRSHSRVRDFPFCRLLRLAGLRWRYSTAPPHGIQRMNSVSLFITSGRTEYKSSPPNSFSIILCLSVAAEACLASRCLANNYSRFQAWCHSIKGTNYHSEWEWNRKNKLNSVTRVIK